MARQPTARSTIKNDPFASVIPIREERPTEVREDQGPAPEPETQAQPEKRQPFRRQKLTVHLRPDLVERVKNAAYWNPRLTITSIAEMGIYHALEIVEKEHGGPYPTREEELRGGRPIR